MSRIKWLKEKLEPHGFSLELMIVPYPEFLDERNL
jgi:hypothetical protein